MRELTAACLASYLARREHVLTCRSAPSERVGEFTIKLPRNSIAILANVRFRTPNLVLKLEILVTSIGQVDGRIPIQFNWHERNKNHMGGFVWADVNSSPFLLALIMFYQPSGQAHSLPLGMWAPWGHISDMCVVNLGDGCFALWWGGSTGGWLLCSFLLLSTR